MKQRLSSMGALGWAAVFAGAALVVRLPFILSTPQLGFKSDERAYLALAHGIFHGKGFQGQHFWTPGYPALEGLLELLPGRTEHAVVAAQHLLGVAVVAAIVVAAWRWFGRPAALVAGAVAAFNPIMIVHEHTLLPDFLFAVLLLAGVFALAEAIRRADPPDLRLLVAAGVLFGLSAWVKSAGQFLFLAAVPALLFATRDARRTLVGSLAVALALLVTISPWLVRNITQHDLASMSNQGDETLFHRVFAVDGMPIPTDQKYGRYAELVRQRIVAQGTIRHTVITFDFHYGMVLELHRSDDEARAAEGHLAMVAIRRHLDTYAKGTGREFELGLEDLKRFDGHDAALGELDRTRPFVGRALPATVWTVVRPLYDLWWLVSLSALAGLLTLVTGSRESRNAAGALVSVWLVLALTTAMGHGHEWRYSAQLGPLTWILGSAGVCVLVSSVRALLSAPARAGPRPASP